MGREHVRRQGDGPNGIDAIRIMFVIGSLQMGGAQKHVYDLIRSMTPDERYTFHVVVFRTGGFYYDRIKDLGVPIHTLDVIHRWDLFLKFMGFLTLVRKIRPHVMHLFLFYSSLYGSVAAKICRPSPAVIFSKRSMGLQISWMRRFVYRHLIMSRADAVTAVSRPVADECVRLGVAPDRVRVIENGIEWMNVREEGHLRKVLGVSADTRLVGTVGSMTTRKCQHLLLQAAPFVLAHASDVHFVIVGEGPLRRDLLKLSETLGLKDRVHLPGILAPATRYISDLSVFTLPSSEEGTSNALLEAMMIGIPCVASDIPSNRQVIDEGVTGFLVDATSSQALAEAILRVLDNKAASAAIVSRARERIAGRYRLDACVEANGSLYLSLATNSESGRSFQARTDMLAKSSSGGSERWL